MIILLIMMALGFWLWYVLAKDAQVAEARRSNLEDLENRRLALENDRFENFSLLVEIAVDEHFPVLLRKRRQLIYLDDYKQPVTDAWEREKRYFLLKHVDRGDDPEYVLEYVDIWSRSIDDHLDIKEITSPDKAVPQLPAAPDDSFNDPLQYERFCAEIAETAGWSATLTPLSGDQGADVVLHRDGRRLVVQCKLSTRPVGNAAVQQAHAAKAFYEAEASAVVAPSGFTPSAKQLAQSTNVHLVHHDDLATFLGRI